MEPTALRDLIANTAVLATGADASSATVAGVAIDSRSAAPGDLFVALRGERSDGHRFVAQALEAGAVGALVSQPIEDAALGRLIVVEDTLRSLGDIARAYRRRFSLPLVGITGSVGKTSVKEMCAAVLRTRFETHANAGNFNNEIGVPLTLFGLERRHTAAILELGMRARGEIDRLAEIAEPSIGLITNIGHAHLEILGSREEIARAKAELLARLPAGGAAILPRHDPFFELLKAAVPVGVRTLTFSSDPALGADVTTTPGPGYYVAAARGDRATGTLRAVGEHHYRNAAAVIALGLALDVTMPEAVAALAEWTGAEGRLVVRELPAGVTVLDDCYNAGPESMQSALATLERMTDGGGVAVLGDMRELGAGAPALHRALGAALVAA